MKNPSRSSSANRKVRYQDSGGVHRTPETGDSGLKHLYAVILAGGSGTRFWPVSRREHPKQLLRLLGRDTLLEQTVERVRPLVPAERTFVFTSPLVHDEVVRLLPGIPREQIVAEPVSRNTAPPLGLAAHEILRRDPEGLMVALPSDHVISKPGAFRNALRSGCRWAAVEGRSVLVGLKPTRPETGYGYIRRGRRAGRQAGHDIYYADKFVEKPYLDTSRRFVKTGKYLWNGGMFIWRASTLIRNFDRFQPRMARLLRQIARAGGISACASFQRLFSGFQKISIDYALLEKISEVFVVAADIGWSDVGSWAVVYELSPKDRQRNVLPSHSLAVGATGNLIVAPGKFVAAVGVRGLAVVETPDALLVCARSRAQDVGKAVREIERRGLTNLL